MEQNNKRNWNPMSVKLNRLTPFDTGIAVIDKMVGNGGLGVQAFVQELFIQKRLMELFVLDEFELYDSALYLLWKDCCKKNLNKVSDVLYAYHTGEVSAQFIKGHINEFDGDPIILFSDWVDSGLSSDELHTPGDLVAEDIIKFYVELGSKSTHVWDSFVQPRAYNYIHRDSDKNVALHTTFYKKDGLWRFLGKCPVRTSQPNENPCYGCVFNGNDADKHNRAALDCRCHAKLLRYDRIGGSENE
jgi:hypothetical protein